jgi:uncharacterized lipoprotein YddW (UPF0748 family)
MNKILLHFSAACVILFLLTGCLSIRTPRTVTERGMWFSYSDYSALCRGMDEAQFTAFTEEAVSNMQTIGITTLYLHAVAFTDALYDSGIFPPSQYLPSKDYDPFAVFTASAEAHGMKVEAWINPLRSVTESQAENLPDDFIVKQWIDSGCDTVFLINGRWYLNPAYPEVRALSCSAARELINKYNINGIQIDDYFYPAGMAVDADSASYAAAREAGVPLAQNSTLDEFRTANIDSLVLELHAAVHSSSPSCTFTVSPSANYAYSRDTLHADPVRWIADGTVDCLIPQLYWGFDHVSKPFRQTAEQYRSFTRGTDVRLIAGLAAYKIGRTDTYAGIKGRNEWTENSNMLARETRYAERKGYSGTAYFSYQSLFAPSAETADAVTAELKNMRKTVR